MPIAQAWGSGERSGSDGQRFAITADSMLATYYPRYFGYYDKALPVLEQAVKAAPSNATIRLMETNTLLNLGAESRDDAQKATFYKKGQASAAEFQKLKPNDRWRAQARLAAKRSPGLRKKALVGSAR